MLIPNNNTQVFSDITIAGQTGVITQLGVRINIEHTFDTDLAIFLIAPSGAVIELSTDNGSSGDNYISTVFTTQPGTGSITAGTAPFTGTFAPEGNLQQVLGTSPNGLWRLRIQDDAIPDVGTLLDWSLEITKAAAFSNTTDFPIPDNNSTGINSPVTVAGLVGNVSQVQVKLNITHTFAGDLDIFLVSPTGLLFELSTDNGGGADNYTNTVFQTGAGFPSITTGAAPFTGVFLPEGAIGSLRELNPNGTWQLRVIDPMIDPISGATGTLLDWSLAITTAANFNAFAAGNLLILTSPQPGYDVNRVVFEFTPAGLTVIPFIGTSINGAFVDAVFPGVTGVLALAGQGDDNFEFQTFGGAVQSTLLVYLSGGFNRVVTSGLNVSGFTLFESGAGRLSLNDLNSTYHGLLVLGGAEADRMQFNSTDVIGASTLILGGGDSQVGANGNSSLGSTVILGSKQLSLNTNVATFDSLLAFSGGGSDVIDMTTTAVTAATTLFLGTGTSSIKSNGSSFTGSFTLFTSGKTNVEVENAPVEGSATAFNGSTLMFVGAGSTLRFGQDLSSDPTFFNSSLTIFSSGTPPTTFRRRNVTMNPALLSLFGVTELP